MLHELIVSEIPHLSFSYLTGWRGVTKLDIGERRGCCREGKESKEPLHVDSLERRSSEKARCRADDMVDETESRSWMRIMEGNLDQVIYQSLGASSVPLIVLTTAAATPSWAISTVRPR